MTLTGAAVDLGWEPHHPETWQYRFANIKEPMTMRHYTGRWENGSPVMNEVELPAGSRVKIVMVSRLGDVGITENLDADVGYGARVELDALYNFDNEP